ncbi:hypothetical protein F0919_09075 [Taibaiella lutea]|uniref:Outer membrane protein beta-barrel domain-containing protein n=1 Tax=Taibaiella lutea TaxID=2608001 RepID=A0A5M6CL88_9BACT|nr:hypothetical protein [Taibaiella lutea]KAA5534752.1 hypothetical protein F0919_09075 [Taibaiella lutea]
MKKIILLSILCLGIGSAFAQETYNSSGKAGKARYKENAEQKGFDPHRLIFGGGLGLGFGTYTNIYVAPSVGYRLTDNFAAGISLGYNYLNIKDYYTSYNANTGAQKSMNLSQSIYSASIWTRYTIIENILLQAELEMNNVGDYQTSGSKFDKDGWAIPDVHRVTIPSLLLGGGYRQPLGNGSYLFMMAMYDVLQNISSNTRDFQGQKVSLSPYAGGIFLRVGFAIGI